MVKIAIGYIRATIVLLLYVVITGSLLAIIIWLAKLLSGATFGLVDYMASILYFLVMDSIVANIQQSYEKLKD